MAPKNAPKPKKAPTAVPEPEDKNSPPDLRTLLAELRTTDLQTQQQALASLFAIREYPGAKVEMYSILVWHSLKLTLYPGWCDMRSCCRLLSALLMWLTACWHSLAPKALMYRISAHTA